MAMWFRIKETPIRLFFYPVPYFLKENRIRIEIMQIRLIDEKKSSYLPEVSAHLRDPVRWITDLPTNLNSSTTSLKRNTIF